jgi:hypothetical protein
VDDLLGRSKEYADLSKEGFREDGRKALVRFGIGRFILYVCVELVRGRESPKSGDVAAFDAL